MSEESFLEFYRRAAWGARAKIMTCIGLAALVLYTASWSIHSILFPARKRSIAAETIAKHKAQNTEIPAFAYPYEIRDVALPLSDRARVRSAFAQFTVILDCPTQSAQKRMVAERPVILDTIIEAGTAVSVEDFKGESGYNTLRKYILTSLRERLGTEAPREIAIKSFLIQ